MSVAKDVPIGFNTLWNNYLFIFKVWIKQINGTCTFLHTLYSEWLDFCENLLWEKQGSTDTYKIVLFFWKLFKFIFYLQCVISKNKN